MVAWAAIFLNSFINSSYSYIFMVSEITQVMKSICEEKGIPYESVLETIQAALAAAYRKDFGNKMQNIQVKFDPETQHIEVFDVKTVVEDISEEGEDIKKSQEGEKNVVDKQEKFDKKQGKESENTSMESAPEERRHFNPKTEIQLSDARKIKKNAKIGDVIMTQLEVPGSFGRMAAQTAKQVIIQKLREVEREMLYNEFKKKEHTVVLGTVQRREGRVVYIDLGKAVGILLPEEQVPREAYNPGDRLKVYVVSVEKTSKGPEILVSRSRPEIVEAFFRAEIPEIVSGAVQIKGIAREAGSRTKIAVWTDQDNIDPIGSCIGQRGARVQTIISELKGEKIDIIEYSDDMEEFIENALSPAKITDIQLNGEEKTALVTVPEDQLSLAIGRSGQNVRLAAKLTGWKIDIVTEGGERVPVHQSADREDEKEEIKEDEIDEKKQEQDGDNSGIKASEGENKEDHQ